MINALANRAAECLKAKIGIADIFKVLRATYPQATRDELEAAVAQGIRNHNAGKEG
jgi:hypothetical protein